MISIQYAITYKISNYFYIMMHFVRQQSERNLLPLLHERIYNYRNSNGEGCAGWFDYLSSE